MRVSSHVLIRHLGSFTLNLSSPLPHQAFHRRRVGGSGPGERQLREHLRHAFRPQLKASSPTPCLPPTPPGLYLPPKGLECTTLFSGSPSSSLAHTTTTASELISPSCTYSVRSPCRGRSGEASPSPHWLRRNPSSIG